MLSTVSLHILLYALLLTQSCLVGMQKIPERTLEESTHTAVDDSHIHEHFLCQLRNQDILTAAEKNSLIQVQNLLDNDADINVQDFDSGNTPLLTACFCTQDSTPLVTLLLEKKADPSITNNELNTPLHYAAFRNKYAVLESLKKAGALLNAQNNIGYTPCHSAVAQNALETIHWLNANRAEMNMLDQSGMAAIHHAVLNGNAATVHQLLKCGGLLYIPTHMQDGQPRIPNGSTPFHLAARNMSAQGYTIKSMLLYYALFYGSNYEKTGLLEGHSLSDRIEQLRAALKLKDAYNQTPHEIEKSNVMCKHPSPSLFCDTHIADVFDAKPTDKLKLDLFNFQDALKKNSLDKLSGNNIFKAAYDAMPTDALPKRVGWGSYLFGWLSWK